MPTSRNQSSSWFRPMISLLLGSVGGGIAGGLFGYLLGWLVLPSPTTMEEQDIVLKVTNKAGMIYNWNLFLFVLLFGILGLFVGNALADRRLVPKD